MRNQRGIRPEVIKQRPLVTPPEAGLNPVPVAADSKKAEVPEAGALDTKREWCRLYQNR